MKQLGFILIALSVTWFSPVQADAEAQWRRGFNIQMPATSRSILLKQGVNPKLWAHRMGLKDYQVDTLGDKGSIINTPMQEREWQNRQTQLCNASGVQSCENTQCQQIQVRGRVRSGPGIQSFRPRLRLVKKAPSLSQLLNPAAGAANYCPADNSDFQRDIAVLTRPPKSANYQLSPDQLPNNPQCWNLVVESACSKTVTPLDTIVPAKLMKRVVVLLPKTGANSTQALATAFGLRVIRQTELTAIGEVLVELEISGTDNVDSLLPRLSADSRISAAQPEFIYRTSTSYGDPYAPLAYGPQKIGAPQLHSRATGKGNIIAIIDTGLDEKHPELSDSIAETMDLTGKGWSADLHGTAIAGIIAAKADNGLGSYGVAPDAKLLALKACQPTEPGKLGAQCWTSSLVRALDLAMQKNANIINMSLGGPPDKLVARMVKEATKQGRLVIAAAGNGGPHAKPAFPAALEEAIAVTAVDALNNTYRQANIGEFIELAAPGVDIVSVSPGEEYPVLSGTSMATAHAAGAAALLRELSPSSSADTIRKALSDSAQDVGEPGPDASFGQGIIDGCQAASAITGNSASCPKAPGERGE